MFQLSQSGNSEKQNKGSSFRQTSNFEHKRLANRFRFSKILHQREDYYLHYGFEIPTKKEVIIISRDRDKNGANKNESEFFKPLWMGNETIGNECKCFYVYYKNGCSIEEYFREVDEIRPIHLHFVLKKFVELIKKLQFKKIILKFIDLKFILLCPVKDNFQNLLLDFFTFKSQSDKKILTKTNNQNLSEEPISENLSPALNFVKKVLFAQNLMYEEPTQFTKVEDLVRKFYEALEKSVIQKMKNKEEFESFSVMFSFFKKNDKKNKQSSYSLNEFLDRFLDIQNTLLKQKMIDKEAADFHGVEDEAGRICQTVMKRNEKNAEKISQILEEEEKEMSLQEWFVEDEFEELKQNDLATSEIVTKHSQRPVTIFKNNSITHHKSELHQEALFEKDRNKICSLSVLSARDF